MQATRTLAMFKSPGTRLRLGAPFDKGGGERHSCERGIFSVLSQGYVKINKTPFCMA